MTSNHTELLKLLGLRKVFQRREVTPKPALICLGLIFVMQTRRIAQQSRKQRSTCSEQRSDTLRLSSTLITRS